jgi:hypothetical protein
MRYPVFHFKDQFSYVFTPARPIEENMLAQLEEVWVLASCKSKYTYVFVGLKDCVIVTNADVDEKEPIPLDVNLPDVCDLVHFTSDDDSECDIDYNRKTKPAFREKMMKILNNLDKDIMMHVFKVDRN